MMHHYICASHIELTVWVQCANACYITGYRHNLLNTIQVFPALLPVLTDRDGLTKMLIGNMMQTLTIHKKNPDTPLISNISMFIMTTQKHIIIVWPFVHSF